MGQDKSLVLKAFGKFVGTVLRQKEIKIRDLAGALGFHDVTEGSEKMSLLKQYGLATWPLVDNLIEALDLDPVKSHILIQRDLEKVARQAKDYWPKYRIHRNGTTFHAIEEGQPEELEVEKLKDEIDRIREEMEPGGRYAVSFPRGYAAARLEAFQSYLSQIEREDFPPGASSPYRKKIALIREGKNPEDCEPNSEGQLAVVLETVIGQMSAGSSHFFGALVKGIKARQQDSVVELLQRRPELSGLAVAVALYLGAKYRCEKVVAHIVTRTSRVDDRPFSAALHVAAEYGYPEIVARLLAAGADPNAPVEFGRTPLMTVCWLDRPVAAKLVEILLDDPRTEVNRTDQWGRTALHWAAFRHQPADVLSLLVRAGADLGKADVDGDTPLHKALCCHDCTKFLLKAGSDVDAEDRFGVTPLLRVLSWGTEGDPAVVQLLLDHGASLNVTNDRGENPWTIAAKWNRVSYLINNREQLLAILDECAEKRRFKIEGQAQPSASGSRRTFCHEIPKKGVAGWIAGLTREELSRELVRAIKRKEECVALAVLEAGANPDMKDWRGDSADSVLYLAAKYGRSEVVAELIDRGVDPDNTERHPALYIAAKQGHTKIVADLLKFGADVNWSDWYGETPLMAACIGGNPSTRELVSLLLSDPRINVNQENESGRTALHYAAFWWQHVEVVSLLVGAGAELNKKDKNGETPLHESLHNYDVAGLLIDSGSDVNAQDKLGLTPLMKLIHLGIKGKIALLKLLVQSGTDLDAHDDKGETAYSLARKRINSGQVIAILEKYSGKDQS